MSEHFEQEREEEERLLPSEKRFGWSFSGVFGVVAVWGLWKGHFLLAGIGGSLSVLFSVVSVVAPEKLRGLNRGWLRFGLLLERVVRPVVVTAIFFLVITPVAVVTRLVGRDALRLKKKQRETYWIEREGGMPSAQSFKNQFQRGEAVEFLKELLIFLRVRKKFWLAPIILLMVMLGWLLIVAKGSVMAPFVYTLFQRLSVEQPL